MQVDSGSAADLLGYTPKVTSEEEKKQNLAQDDFIKLMLSQFQNQDPFSPQDNGDFLAQMAQFSTVEGIGDMQKSMDAMVSGLKSSQVLEASTLVGKSALVPSDGFDFEGHPMYGSVDVPINAQSIKIDITDGYGGLVDSVVINNQGPGLVDFEWDGLDSNGDALASKRYEMSATFFNGKESEAAPTLVWGYINSVSLDSNGTSSELEITGVGNTELDSIREVSY